MSSGPQSVTIADGSAPLALGHFICPTRKERNFKKKSLTKTSLLITERLFQAKTVAPGRTGENPEEEITPWPLGNLREPGSGKSEP